MTSVKKSGDKIYNFFSSFSEIYGTHWSNMWISWDHQIKETCNFAFARHIHSIVMKSKLQFTIDFNLISQHNFMLLLGLKEKISIYMCILMEACILLTVKWEYLEVFYFYILLKISAFSLYWANINKQNVILMPSIFA